MTAKKKSRKWEEAHPDYQRLWNQRNPEKRKAYGRKYYYKRQDKIRDYNYRTKYGSSLAEYNKMHAEQNGKCAICERSRELVVDHCHSTGIVRSLLCDPCNRGIGMLNDNPHFLYAAAIYLTPKLKVA